jgi:iron complex outermembrane receptor protein
VDFWRTCGKGARNSRRNRPQTGNGHAIIVAKLQQCTACWMLTRNRRPPFVLRRLVLLNGRRVAPAANADPNTGQGQAYNLNTIPLSAIERIEILKDGASAIYGSDAIAGVINFILRKDYQGAEIGVSGGSTLENVFRNYTVNATAGFGDLAKNRYNVLLSGEYFSRTPVDYRQPNAVENNDYLPL